MSTDTEAVSVNGQNGSPEDLKTLLKEMATLREESRLERSRNADIDCTYLYVQSIVTLEPTIYNTHANTQ